MILLLAAAFVWAGGAAEDQSGSGDGELKPLNFLFSSTFSETETGGQILKHFQDYLSESTDGKIKATIKWGGTLYQSPDELEAVSSGAVQMIALGHNPHFDMLPLLCSFPDFAPDSSQNALDFFKHVVFEDPSSSAVLTGEAEANNVKYLNVIAGGANTFLADFPFTDMASMVKGSTSFGNMEAAKFEYLGFRVTQVLPWDLYDAFDRGVIDASQMSLAPLVSMSLYEVADTWMLDNTYTAGNFLTVNLDWWNGLSAAQQEAIQAAADEVMEYSAGIYDAAIADQLKLLQDEGATVVTMNDADFTTWWDAVFMSKVDSSLKMAEGRGDTDKVKAVLKSAAEFTGYQTDF